AIPGSEPLHRIEGEALICAHAQVLIANTADEKQELIKFTGVPEERVQVVRPGVDHRIFRPVGTNRWPGRPANQAPKILFAGRIQRYNGSNYFIANLDVARDSGL